MHFETVEVMKLSLVFQRMKNLKKARELGLVPLTTQMLLTIYNNVILCLIHKLQLTKER